MTRVTSLDFTMRRDKSYSASRFSGSYESSRTREDLLISEIVMAVQVKLGDVVEHLEMSDGEISAYLNKLTGELCALSHEELSAAEDDDEDLSDYPEWERAEILKAREVLSSSDWLELPGKFEIHEWDIMDQFCQSIEDPEVSNRLLRSIRGSGAFRRFKDSVYDLGIEKTWYQFRDAALEQIAIDWLEENGIAFIKGDV